MNKPMEDFVTRGGLGELMAAAQQALEGLQAQPGQQPRTSGFRTIPVPTETGAHVGPCVDTTQWWNITRRLDAAIRDTELAREQEAVARQIQTVVKKLVAGTATPADLKGLQVTDGMGNVIWRGE